MDSATVRAKHKEFLFPCVANYYAEPVVITEAHGSSVKDLDGREYVDFFGGILTAGIGHSHPDFVVGERELFLCIPYLMFLFSSASRCR